MQLSRPQSESGDFDKSNEGMGWVMMVDDLIINNFHTSCDSEPIHMVQCGAEFPLASLATGHQPPGEHRRRRLIKSN
jgi:hypothetical protein